MATRTTIYLDDSLLSRVRRYIPQRGLSQFVNEILLERIAQFEQAEIEAQMREGYLATRQERQEINADWRVVDGEGWPV